MSKASSRIQTGARLPPELVEQLRNSAEQNGRTLSAEMELAVRGYLEDKETGQLPPELIQIIESWYRAKKQANGSR